MTIRTWPCRPKPLATIRTSDGTTVEVYAPPSSRTTPPAPSSPRLVAVTPEGCQVFELRRRAA